MRGGFPNIRRIPQRTALTKVGALFAVRAQKALNQIMDGSQERLIGFLREFNVLGQTSST